MTPNPFSRLSKPDSGSEMIVQAKPSLDDAVVKAYNTYTGLKPNIRPYRLKDLWGLEEQILSPGQIDGLLQLIIQDTEQKKLNDSVTGAYLSKLIQDSYNAGNNDFVLNTEDTNINSLGYNVSGKFYRKLKLSINGNAGYGCGEESKYSKITISGNIYNNIYNSCGLHAKHSEITILGTVSCCWNGMGAIKTTFNVHNEYAYEMFGMYIDSGLAKGNRLRLIDYKGKIIKRMPR